MSPFLRVSSLLALTGCLVAACGGKIEGNGGGGGGSGGGGSCVNIDLSSYDQSCQSASDCVYIASGQVCSGQCDCPDAVINASGQAEYEVAIASVTPAACFCPGQAEPQCNDHQCSLQSLGGGTPCSGPDQAAGCPDGG